jgi:hypothetical protein
MRSIRDENGKAVAFVNRSPREKANAALITAAPRLLACLQKYFDHGANPPMWLREACKELLREIDAESQP